MPPCPSESERAQPGIAIRGLEEKDKQWFYPYQVQLVDGELKSSNGYGVLGVVNGHGGTPGEAFAHAYDIASRMRVLDLQYRTDLLCACLKDLRELREIFDGNEGEWDGVDLDGTLASYGGWSNDIGDPIPTMVNRVKRWIREGREVRIFTARGSVDGEGEASRYKQLIKIYDWINEHIGESIEVTHEKDPKMRRLYDDRVVQVKENEGTLVK
jgi:hypothetical protein